MKKLLLLAMLLFFPLAVQAGKNDAKNTVRVEIETNRGPTSIALVRKGDGFVGPRGEYYPTFPTKKTLSAVYGAPASKPVAPVSKPAAASMGETKVVVVPGGVNIRRDGKRISEIRTKLPNVEGWKLVRENTAIVIKSGVSREPGVVELFDVNSGRLLERVKANAIKDGKPAWAKNFAE